MIAGCGAKSNSASTDTQAATNQDKTTETRDSLQKLKVQVSFYPMYEFAKNVAGDLAEVESLVPSGVEPHDWEPSPQDIKKIAESDVLIYNGAGMEGWIDQVTVAASNSNLLTIEASKGIEIMEGEGHHHDHDDHDHEHADGEEHSHDHDHEHEGEEAEGHHDHDHEGEEAEGHHHHDHGGLDPHVWLSPALAIKEVRNIEAGLAEAAPEHREEFKKNADAYVAKLEQLDADFKSELSNTKRKDFITQHTAFGYLAKEYGLNQVAIAGLSPEQEPTAAQMAEVVSFAKEHNVKVIFFETLVSSKVAETISKEIGAEVSVLNPIEGLRAEDVVNKLDYIAIQRQNLENLKQALNQ